MQKPLASAVAAALFLFGVIAWVLEFVEKATTAAEIYDFTVANVSVHVHWPTIYLFLTILGACLFVGLNGSWVARRYEESKKQRHRVWDQALLAAAQDVIFRSNTRFSLRSGGEISEAISIIESCARDGKITVAGRLSGNGSIVPISKKLWKTARLMGRVDDDMHGHDQLVDIHLIDRIDSSKVVMSGLMVDHAQFHKSIK